MTFNRRYFGVLAYRGQQNQKSSQRCQKRKRCVCLAEQGITCLLCKAAQTHLKRQLLLNLGLKLSKKSPIFTRIFRSWRPRSKPKKAVVSFVYKGPQQLGVKGGKGHRKSNSLLLKTVFLSEDRSKSFSEMSLHLCRYEVFVRSLIKTKGHGYINLTTKVSIVRGDPVPGCLLHLTVRVNTTALCAWLRALPDTTTPCSHRVSSSVTTGYRTNSTLLASRHLCSLWSAPPPFESEIQSSITAIHWRWM